MEVELATAPTLDGGGAAATPKDAVAIKSAGPVHVDVNKIAVDASVSTTFFPPLRDGVLPLPSVRPLHNKSHVASARKWGAVMGQCEAPLLAPVSVGAAEDYRCGFFYRLSLDARASSLHSHPH